MEISFREIFGNLYVLENFLDEITRLLLRNHNHNLHLSLSLSIIISIHEENSRGEEIESSFDRFRGLIRSLWKNEQTISPAISGATRQYTFEFATSLILELVARKSASGVDLSRIRVHDNDLVSVTIETRRSEDARLSLDRHRSSDM